MHVEKLKGASPRHHPARRHDRLWNLVVVGVRALLSEGVPSKIWDQPRSSRHPDQETSHFNLSHQRAVKLRRGGDRGLSRPLDKFNPSRPHFTGFSCCNGPGHADLHRASSPRNGSILDARSSNAHDGQHFRLMNPGNSSHKSSSRKLVGLEVFEPFPARHSTCRRPPT